LNFKDLKVPKDHVYNFKGREKKWIFPRGVDFSGMLRIKKFGEDLFSRLRKFEIFSEDLLILAKINPLKVAVSLHNTRKRSQSYTKY